MESVNFVRLKSDEIISDLKGGVDNKIKVITIAHDRGGGVIPITDMSGIEDSIPQSCTKIVRHSYPKTKFNHLEIIYICPKQTNF